MIKRISVGVILLSCVLYGVSNSEVRTDEYIDNIRLLTGDVFSAGKNSTEVDDTTNSKYDTYMDTVIWNDIFRMKTKNVNINQSQPKAEETITLDDPLDRLNKKYIEDSKKADSLRKNDEINSTIPDIFAGGYCTLHDTLSISKAYEFARLDCLMNIGKNVYRKVEVFASFYPDYKREIVVALPIYATFEDQRRASFSGVVLKEDKTSLNLSSWVDNKRIQKMLGEGLLAVNDIAYNYTNGYLRANADARLQTDITYLPTQNNQNGGNSYIPIRQTRTAPPEIRDYVVGGTIEILTSIASIFGKDYLHSSTPLFAVYPQRVYVEGILSFDNAGLSKRFGFISRDQEKRTDTNNKQWEKQKLDTIKKYDRTYRIPTIKNVTPTR